MRRVGLVLASLLGVGCFGEPPTVSMGSDGEPSTGNPTGTATSTATPTTSASETVTSRTTGSTATGSEGSSASASGPTTSSMSTSDSGSTTEAVMCEGLPVFPIPGACPSDIPDELPLACTLDVAMGAPFTGCDDFAPSADGLNFVADDTGTYVFSVISEQGGPDPALVLTDPDHVIIGCSDDLGALEAAAIAFDLEAGQEVEIHVPLEEGRQGSIELRVARQLDCGGDCCVASARMMGCQFPARAECTCGYDDACCMSVWSEACVRIATGLCLAGCGSTVSGS